MSINMKVDLKDHGKYPGDNIINGLNPTKLNDLLHPSPCAIDKLPVLTSFQEYLKEIKGSTPSTIETKSVIIKALSCHDT